MSKYTVKKSKRPNDTHKNYNFPTKIHIFEKKHTHMKTQSGENKTYQMTPTPCPRQTTNLSSSWKKTATFEIDFAKVLLKRYMAGF